MRILFIGCVEFSMKALQKVIDTGHQPVAIITKSRSAVNSDFADLSVIAEKYIIPYKYVNDINHPANIEWIRAQEPDIIFCFGWSSLLKKEILDSAPSGVIGYHPALLPYNRGRHPIIWALALGLQETGSSFFFMDIGADSGDILSQEKILIQKNDDGGSLYKKMTETAIRQIGEFLPALADGTFRRIPQEAHVGNSWRKRSKSDGRIDFRMTSTSIINLVKALTKPYPGAYIEWNSCDIPVWSAKEGEKGPDNIEPGKVLEMDGQAVRVKCGVGSVWLLQHEIQTIPQAGEYLI